MHKGKLSLINTAAVYADTYAQEDCDPSNPDGDCYNCNADDPDSPCYCASGNEYQETTTGSDNCFTYISWTNHYWDCESIEDTDGSFTNALTSLTAASVSLYPYSGNVNDAVTVSAGATTKGDPGITYNYEEYNPDTEKWSSITSTSDESIVYIIDVPGEIKFRVTAVSGCDGSHVMSSERTYIASDIAPPNCAFIFDPMMTTTKDAGGGALAGLYGRTETGPVDFTMGVCSDGTNWHPYLLTMTGHYYSQSQLGPGITEVTGPSGNTNASNFCDQMKDLENLGYNATNTGPGSWYMLSAVEAHENFHVSKLGPSFQECLSFFKSAVAGYNIPLSGNTQQSAQSMLSLQANTYSVKQLMTRYWNLQMALDSIDDEIPGSGPELAERAATAPMVTSICDFSKAPAQNWGPCPGSTCQ